MCAGREERANDPLSPGGNGFLTRGVTLSVRVMGFVGVIAPLRGVLIQPTHPHRQPSPPRGGEKVEETGSNCQFRMGLAIGHLDDIIFCFSIWKQRFMAPENCQGKP